MNSGGAGSPRRLVWLIRNFWLLAMVFNLILVLAVLFFLLVVS
jgi:hypothetical protein